MQWSIGLLYLDWPRRRRESDGYNNNGEEIKNMQDISEEYISYPQQEERAAKCKLPLRGTETRNPLLSAFTLAGQWGLLFGATSGHGYRWSRLTTTEVQG